MFEEIFPFLQKVYPILSPIVILVVCAYIIKKSGFLKSTKKIIDESDNSKQFLKSYFSLSFGFIKMIQVWLVKYAIYIAVYGFILSNAYFFVGFEGTVLFGIALTIARIQMKKTNVTGVPYEEYSLLKKKYILTRKLLDEKNNPKT